MDEQKLGDTEIKITCFYAIDPNTLPEDTNLYGRIYCQEQPLANVFVSDGIEIAKTDINGIYSLNTKGYNGTVFVTLPSGYEAPTIDGIPQFYALLEDGRCRYDFALDICDQKIGRASCRESV